MRSHGLTIYYQTRRETLWTLWPGVSEEKQQHKLLALRDGGRPQRVRALPACPLPGRRASQGEGDEEDKNIEKMNNKIHL